MTDRWLHRVTSAKRAMLRRRDLLAGGAGIAISLAAPTTFARSGVPPMRPAMDVLRAEQFAGLALSWINREYPASPGLSRLSAEESASPKINHPVFYGGFDWNSSVANHWLIARLLRTYPNLRRADEIAARFDRVLSEENVAAETAYFAKPDRQGFGRPVGWGYVMLLSTEFGQIGSERAARWQRLLQPLVNDLRRRTIEFLPKLRFAGRGGSLPIGLSMMVEYARASGDQELLAIIRQHALSWYRGRVIERYPQVGGEESIPSEWATADLMRRVLELDRFARWFVDFAPDLVARRMRILLDPLVLSDRSDPRLALANDLMNVNRGWLLERLAAASTGASATVLRTAADLHLAASLPHLEDNEYTVRAIPPRALCALERI